ncbi:MAG TPA: hypothetical protein VFY23_10325 [Candidatus Limnocylindrales bacterium]|nr:hypothetical protein [Candidatus Limnocylindrales bacterium]
MTIAPPPLDALGVARITSLPDPLERNAAITRGYHVLSEAVAALLGREHANWLTFGQWASAEARRSISGLAVPAPLRPVFGDDVREAVAAGNAAIFGDVAPPFIRFLGVMGPIASEAGRVPAHETGARLDAALGALIAHPQLAASADLARAFRAYSDALRLRLEGMPGGPAYASRILVANASVGAHEQRVADPYVRAAIPGRWIAAVAATAHMSLRLPEGVLELERDVPPPAYLHGAPFPPELATLEDVEALALARRFGLDDGSPARSGAPDWESYDERMGFIFTLLRAHQCDPSLFDLPPDTPGAGDPASPG